jgi:hypothetical protein
MVPRENVPPSVNVQAALRLAVDRIKSNAQSGTDRIWIIRSFTPDLGVWQNVLRRKNVKPLNVGGEPLLVYRPF